MKLQVLTPTEKDSWMPLPQLADVVDEETTDKAEIPTQRKEQVLPTEEEGRLYCRSH